jgi:hypothetical protein
MVLVIEKNIQIVKGQQFWKRRLFKIVLGGFSDLINQNNFIQIEKNNWNMQEKLENNHS